MTNEQHSTQRVTIAMMADALLSSGEAKTKTEALAKARLEVAKKNTEKAAAKVKAIEDAKKRLQKEQAKKERFAQSEKNRKARTRKLIEAGGLIAKAGLLNWEPAMLLGGLLVLAQQGEKHQLAWREMGVKALKAVPAPPGPSQAPGAAQMPTTENPKTASEPEAPKTPLVRVAVETPEGKPSAEICKALREMGLLWQDINYDRVATSGSELQKSWQGSIPVDKISVAKQFVEEWHGVFIQLEKV